jgi:tryptophan-rich sensory protein
MSNIVRSLVLMVGFTISIYVATQLLVDNGLINQPSFAVATLGTLLFATILIYFFLIYNKSKHPLDFVRNYLLTLVLKIIFGGFYAFVIMRLDPPLANSNAAFFLICYFIFTALEVTLLTIKKNAE